ncbi:hypothetical protein GCM10027295_12780 [Pseudaeromonas pectinilytica]
MGVAGLTRRRLVLPQQGDNGLFQLAFGKYMAHDNGFFCWSRSLWLRYLWAQFPFAVAAYVAPGQPDADTPCIHPWRLEGIIPDAYGRLIGYPRHHISAPVGDPHPKGTAPVSDGLIHLFRGQLRLNIIQP